MKGSSKIHSVWHEAICSKFDSNIGQKETDEAIQVFCMRGL